MARPRVVARATTTTSADGTSRTLNIPAPISGNGAGDLLLVLLANDGTVTISSWGIFTAIGGLTRAWAARRQCDGTEGATANITLSASEKIAAVVLRIQDHDPSGSFNPVISTAATGTNADPNATVAVLAATRDALWVTFFGTDTSVAQPIVPSGYSNLQFVSSTGSTTGTNTSIGTAEKTALAVLTEDAPLFDGTNNVSWTAFTVGVYGRVAATFDDSVSLPADGTVAQGRAADLLAMLSALTADAAIAVAEQHVPGLTELALAAAVGSSFAPGVDVQRAFALAADSSVLFAGGLAVEGMLTLGGSAGATFAATLSIDAALGLDAGASVTPVRLHDALGALGLDADAAFALSRVATLETIVALEAAAVLAIEGEPTIEAAASFLAVAVVFAEAGLELAAAVALDAEAILDLQGAGGSITEALAFAVDTVLAFDDGYRPGFRWLPAAAASDPAWAQPAAPSGSTWDSAPGASDVGPWTKPSPGTDPGWGRE